MKSTGQELAQLFGREIDRLAGEIAAYGNDSDVWTVTGAQKNSAGTLAIHLVGNLNHYIGALFGNTGYVRDRDREFSERDVPRDEIVQRIRQCREDTVRIVADMDDGTFAATMPGEVPPALEGASVRMFVMHLLWHIGWHNGHVYYHRLGAGRSVAE